MQKVSIKSFGAVGDGLTNETQAFKKALSALRDGETLLIEAGTYRTGPLEINARGLVIEFESGAVISFIADENLYPPVYSRWEGVNCYCMHPCLLINSSDGVVLRGDGVLDGGGEYWWEIARRIRLTQKEPVTPVEKMFAALNPGYKLQGGGGGGRLSQFLRPPLVQVLRSTNVELDGLTLRNSPFWTLHPVYSSNLVISNLKISNPEDAPNTDGIDVDSCRFVTIRDCEIAVGDDGIVLKSGSGADGIAVNEPTTDILIENCRVLNAHGGTAIGSETAGGVYNVTVRNCFFDGTDRGIRIKTRRGRGGAVSNIVFSSIRMRRNLCPLALNMYYRCDCTEPEKELSPERREITETTPYFGNIVVDGCISEDAVSSAGFVVGLPERPIENLKISNCFFGVASDGLRPISESEMYAGIPDAGERGIRFRNVGLTVSKVTVEGVRIPMIIEDGVELHEI